MADNDTQTIAAKNDDVEIILFVKAPPSGDKPARESYARFFMPRAEFDRMTEADFARRYSEPSFAAVRSHINA